MFSRILLCVVTLILFSACSGKVFNTETKEEKPAGIEVADDKSFDDEIFVEEDQILDDSAIASKDEIIVEQNLSTMRNDPVGKTLNPVIPKVDQNAEFAIYDVSKNETLMLIAFKLYGDYKKWREIARHNLDILKDGQTVSEGMKIKYLPPVEDFVWTPEGDPYLIKWGDTLGKISSKVYDNIKRWKEIWNNNKPLIKNPNKIYAGFTIYYVPDTGNIALNK